MRALPTTWVADTGRTSSWPVVVAALLVVLVAAVVLGARPAAWALGLPPREELRVQSGVHEARHVPEPRWGSPDRALLRRLDRGSVWRSVGMRRGLMVLGIGPGLVALVAGLEWSSVMLLPGLTASGAALLFGVNAWCLDGKGMVWRETLPVSARDVFDVRALVVAECTAAVSGTTVVLALLRNGLPPLVVGVSVLACWAVVLVQVLAIVMTWSIRSPYSVDLSSPRATPAPHAAMAGYAGKLSLVTTLTGMLFTGLAALPWAWVPPVLALPFLAWSRPAAAPCPPPVARTGGASTGRADRRRGLRRLGRVRFEGSPRPGSRGGQRPPSLKEHTRAQARPPRHRRRRGRGTHRPRPRDGHRGPRRPPGRLVRRPRPRQGQGGA